MLPFDQITVKTSEVSGELTEVLKPDGSAVSLSQTCTCSLSALQVDASCVSAVGFKGQLRLGHLRPDLRLLFFSAFCLLACDLRFPRKQRRQVRLR